MPLDGGNGPIVLSVESCKGFLNRAVCRGWHGCETVRMLTDNPTDPPRRDHPGGIARAADAPLLEMRGITKGFPGVRALKGVSLDVRAGEVRALLGENGAGKSTLMNILAGVFSDYGGEIRIDGHPVPIRSPLAARNLGIAMIHQELNLIPELSVADNIFLGREPHTRRGTIDRRRMHRAAADLLARSPRPPAGPAV